MPLCFAYQAFQLQRSQSIHQCSSFSSLPNESIKDHCVLFSNLILSVIIVFLMEQWTLLSALTLSLSFSFYLYVSGMHYLSFITYYNMQAYPVSGFICPNLNECSRRPKKHEHVSVLWSVWFSNNSIVVKINIIQTAGGNQGFLPVVAPFVTMNIVELLYVCGVCV